jgi:hypothetical protein
LGGLHVIVYDPAWKQSNVEVMKITVAEYGG